MKVLFYFFLCLRFVFLVVFIPKDPAVVGKHSLILSTIVFVVIAVVRRRWLNFLLEWSGFRVFVTVISFYFISMLCLVGHLLAFNAVLGKQKVICITGVIVSKFKDESRLGNVNNYVEYTDSVSGAIDVMRVTLKEYTSYDIGLEVKKSWRSGLLGYVYQTAIGEGPGNVRYNGCEMEITKDTLPNH